MQPQQIAAAPQPTYMLPAVESLSPPPSNLIIGKARSQWSTIRHMVALVIICFFLMTSLTIIPMGIIDRDGPFTLAGTICSLPILFLFFHFRKPKLLHVMVVEPFEGGKNAHPLPGGRTLTTPHPSRFRHHLVRDSTLLDIPTTGKLWSVFTIVIITSITLFILMILQPDNLVILLIALAVGIPFWMVGFAIPVFAWWSYSTRSLGLPTKRHEAESVLSAGFLSTFPAVIINSILFPLLLLAASIDPLSEAGEIMLLTLSAPIGEELCKAAAVLCCYRFIDSPRRGFQVGFTVGLGFAMLENIMYVSASFSEGFAGFAITSFLRGIGSIPGHAVWTGLSGLGIGWLLYKKPTLGGILPKTVDSPSADFVIFDAKTGQMAHNPTGSGNSAQSMGIQAWNVQQYINSQQKKKPWALPTTPLTGIVLAMLGHSFWNGSSFLVYFIVEKAAGEVAGIIAMILWTFTMIATLLWIGKNILSSLHSVPSS